MRPPYQVEPPAHSDTIPRVPLPSTSKSSPRLTRRFYRRDPVTVARALLGNDAWIGASLHSPDDFEAAAGSDLSYAHLAPIWDPKSKPASRPALGLEALARAATFGLPVLAQAGLDAGRARLAIGAGAAGIAVTGQLSGSADPAAIAAELRRGLDQASEPAGSNPRNQWAPAGY